MTMPLLQVIHREWHRLLTQPTYWAALFVLPLISLVCLSAIFPVPRINGVVLDIVDLDRSSASRDLMFRLDASSAVNLGETLLKTSDALTRAQQKKSFGYLVIPEDFHRSLVNNEQVSVSAYVNQQAYLMGNILSSQVISHVLQSSLKETAVHLMTGGAVAEQALAQIVPLAGSRSVLGNSHLNYQSYLLASLLPHLWHVLVMVTTVIVIGHEFKTGTAGQWMDTANGHLAIALIGKLLIPATVLALWLAAIEVYVIRITGLIPFTNLPALLLAGLVTQFAYHCAGLMVITVTHNYRLALSMTALYTAPAFAFVGVTFPTFDMNTGAQLWQSLLPISQYLQIQNQMMHWHGTLIDIAPTLGNLGIFCLVFSVPSFVILRRKVHQSHYWYKH